MEMMCILASCARIMAAMLQAHQPRELVQVSFSNAYLSYARKTMRLSSSGNKSEMLAGSLSLNGTE